MAGTGWCSFSLPVSNRGRAGGLECCGKNQIQLTKEKRDGCKEREQLPGVNRPERLKVICSVSALQEEMGQ